MNPVQDLLEVEDWDSFTPSAKGYLPPTGLDIQHEGVVANFELYTAPNYLRETEAPLLVSNYYPDAVNPGIKIRDLGYVKLPLECGDISILTSAGCWTGIGALHIPVEKVTIENPRWNAFVHCAAMKVCKDLLCDPTLRIRCELVGIAIRRTADDKVKENTVVAGTGHFATLKVVLPSRIVGGRIVADHNGKRTEMNVSEDSAYTTTVFGMYAGLSGVSLCAPENREGLVFMTYDVYAKKELNGTGLSILSVNNLSGAVPELRDAFRLWRQALNNQIAVSEDMGIPPLLLFPISDASTCASELLGADKALVSHLCPPAKLYGFRVYFGQLHLKSSCEKKVAHQYKDYYFDDSPFDPDSWEMDKDADVEVSIEVLDLGGQSVPRLVGTNIEKILTPDNVESFSINGATDDFDLEADDEGLDDSLYEATYRLEHDRTGGVLIVVAEEALGFKEMAET